MGTKQTTTAVLDAPAASPAVADDDQQRAVWTTAYQNDLPDSAFAVIEPGGKKDEEGKTTPRSKRHFPIRDKDGQLDEAHVHNAISRLPTAKLSTALLSKARSAIYAAAKKLGIEVSGDENRAIEAAIIRSDPDLMALLAQAEAERQMAEPTDDIMQAAQEIGAAVGAQGQQVAVPLQQPPQAPEPPAAPAAAQAAQAAPPAQENRAAAPGTAVDAPAGNTIIDTMQKAVLWAPFTRVDAAKREVEGVLTSEAVDTFGTIFDYDTMKRIVQSPEGWYGNVREQHDPSKAVGRKVDVACNDAERTIRLRSRVSLGAEDTWQKVLDGTLAGYSIGALDCKVKERRAIEGRSVPVLAPSMLAEVSLVDRPSNPDSAKSGLIIYRSASELGAGAAALDDYATAGCCHAGSACPAGDACTCGGDCECRSAVAADPATGARATVGTPTPAEQNDVGIDLAPAAAVPAGPQITPAEFDDPQNGRPPTAGAPAGATGDDGAVQDQTATAPVEPSGAARKQHPDGEGGEDGADTEDDGEDTEEKTDEDDDNTQDDQSGSTKRAADPAASVAPPHVGDPIVPQPPASDRAAFRVASEADLNVRGQQIQDAENAIAHDQTSEQDHAHSEHDHPHASGYEVLHIHDGPHTHQDGTTHSHPHMHAHDHHDHFGDPTHSHPHSHVHDHSHEYRAGGYAADLTKWVPQADDSQQQAGAAGVVPGVVVGAVPVGQPMTRRQEVRAALTALNAGDPPAVAPAAPQAAPAAAPAPQQRAAAPTQPQAAQPAAAAGAKPPASAQQQPQPQAQAAIVTPDAGATRVGARVSGATRTKLHSAIQANLEACNCPTCQDAMSLYDPDGDGDDDSTAAGDTDNDHAGKQDRAAQAEGQRGAKMQRLLIARETRAVLTTQLEAGLAAIFGPLAQQFRSIAARLATVQPTADGAPDVAAQLTDVRSAMAEVQGLVRQIASVTPMPGGPVTRMVPGMAVAAERFMATDPRAIAAGQPPSPEDMALANAQAIATLRQNGALPAGVIDQDTQLKAATAMIQQQVLGHR